MTFSLGKKVWIDPGNAARDLNAVRTDRIEALRATAAPPDPDYYDSDTSFVLRKIRPSECFVGKNDLAARLENSRPQEWNLFTLTNRLGAYKSKLRWLTPTIFTGFYEPSGHIIE